MNQPRSTARFEYELEARKASKSLEDEQQRCEIGKWDSCSVCSPPAMRAAAAASLPSKHVRLERAEDVCGHVIRWRLAKDRRTD